MTRCVACGMPMNVQEDFAMGDVQKNYCIHCAKQDGTMQSYEEKLASMTGFIVKTQGLDQEVAAERAKALMKQLPAWRQIYMKSYDNFFLGVDELEQAKEYYQGILGLKMKFDFSPQGMVAFQVGEEEPAIILKDRAKFPEIKPTIWFVVDNVESEYQKLSDKGVTFCSEPFQIKTGMAVEFEDPFGNRLGITDYSRD